MVFELTTAENCRLGGGGRYDELARLLGAGIDVPAVGFTYYADELLKRAIFDEQGNTQAITIVVPPGTDVAGVRWSQILRKQGYKVEVVPKHAVFAATNRRAPLPSSAPIVLSALSGGLIEWNGKTYSTTAADNLVADMEKI
jgi:histidyl-tRNA synthetase